MWAHTQPYSVSSSRGGPHLDLDFNPGLKIYPSKKARGSVTTSSPRALGTILSSPIESDHLGFRDFIEVV